MTRRRLHGFTLIELAIGLVILALLFGGLLLPLSAQIKARRIQETQRILEQTRESLIGYALSHRDSSPSANPYLPCPDVDGDGVSDSAGGNCTATTGRLPWVTLGIGEADAWGNRFQYSVTQAFASNVAGFVRFPATTQADRSVCSSVTCTGTSITPAAVIVSHGSNGYGAQNSLGSVNISPTSPDELENGNGDAVFVSRAASGEDNALGEFDDLVAWLMPDYLFARVCSPTEPDC
jgi:prepilin-type N-terminal cleavage/methylation domain-containing protein